MLPSASFACLTIFFRMREEQERKSNQQSFLSHPTHTQMLVVSDLVDIYAPASSQLLMPVREYKDALLALLESLPAMWASSRSPESAAVAAIEGAVDLLKETGGKVHAFLAGLPSLGPHALRSRDGVVAGEREKPAYLASQDNTLRTLAVSAADHMVCIDLSFLAQVGRLSKPLSHQCSS